MKSGLKWRGKGINIEVQMQKAFITQIYFNRCHCAKFCSDKRSEEEAAEF
jgi:hypothetical protein